MAANPARILPFPAVAYEAATIRFDEASSAATARELIRVPDGARVVKVDVIVLDAFDGTGAALKVGDGSDDDGYFTAALSAVGVAGLKTTLDTGSTAAYAAAGGRFYATEDTIDAKFTPGTSATKGLALVVVTYEALNILGKGGLQA